MALHEKTVLLCVCVLFALARADEGERSIGFRESIGFFSGRLTSAQDDLFFSPFFLSRMIIVFRSFYLGRMVNTNGL